jgi:hypothetical protein
VLDPAERVRDAVLPAVVDEQHARLADGGFAPRAAGKRRLLMRVLVERPRPPVRSLHSPRNDMLESAERGNALPGLLDSSISLLRVDRLPAPITARLGHLPHPTATRLAIPLAAPKPMKAWICGYFAVCIPTAQDHCAFHPRPGIPYEHMFPPALTRLAETAFEIADAMLAPTGFSRPDEQADHDLDDRPHAHGRPLLWATPTARAAGRRPGALARPAQPCASSTTNRSPGRTTRNPATQRAPAA